MAASDRQKINEYLQKKANDQIRQLKSEQPDYTGPTIEKPQPYQTTGGVTTIGRRMRAAFGTAKQKGTVNLQEKHEEDVVSKLFKGLKPATPPKFTPDPKTVKLNNPLPFEGMKTSILPAALYGEEETPPPPPKSSYEKPVNFQKVQDAVRRRQLRQLTAVERIGHNISNIGARANQTAAGWPYIPGGFVFPFVLLLILFFILIPIGGFTRLQWLFLTMTGHAGVNASYTPPQQPTPGVTQGELSLPPGQGSGPDYNTDIPVGLYTYVPLSMEAYMDEE